MKGFLFILDAILRGIRRLKRKKPALYILAGLPDEGNQYGPGALFRRLLPCARIVPPPLADGVTTNGTRA